jgi:hypothetical protein
LQRRAQLADVQAAAAEALDAVAELRELSREQVSQNCLFLFGIQLRGGLDIWVGDAQTFVRGIAHCPLASSRCERRVRRGMTRGRGW